MLFIISCDIRGIYRKGICFMTEKIARWLMFLLVISFTPAFAANTVNNTAESPKCSYGIEIDALPYVTGGSYISSWIGREKYRLRLVLSDVNIPEFIYSDNFKDWNSKARAIIFDYFWNPQKQPLSGPWIGFGLERWDNEIVEKSSGAKAFFDQEMLTVGGGYVHYLSKHCFINPWVAGHLRLNGDSNIQVGSKTFKNKPLQFEASLKLGWEF